jgi:pimeloyl-ACP methyl ester carboxylesterase
MLPFLFSWRRREKVEWFMDQYAEIIARYPKARLHYVGHSNGTYCLARALQLYPSCRFERVVFAGSVVRSSFDWSRFMANHPPQVGSVLNYIATADWVVAGFPRLFEFLGFGDLGGAGYNGFAEKDHPCLKGRFDEVAFVRGPHDAALQEKHWDAIAEYVYSGLAERRDADVQNPVVKVIGAFPPLAWLLAAAVALVGAAIVGLLTYAAVQLVFWVLAAAHLHPGGVHAVALTLAVTAALTVIWKGVTKL